MNGLEELINMRDKGHKWLTINRKNWIANTFKEMPYWHGNKWNPGFSSNGARVRGVVSPYNVEKLELKNQKGFTKPIPIGEAIEILQKYHQRIDMVKQSDMVKNPDHYTWKKKECREIQRDMVDGLSGMAASNMGNIIKYLYRVGHKDDIKQDLDKAKQFIDFLYEDLQRENN